MAKVRRANVVLEIKDEQIERFVDMGYDVIDDKGNVVKKSVPHDVNTLTIELQKALKENAKLKEELESLKAKKQPAKEVVKEPETVVETKSTSTKSKK